MRTRLAAGAAAAASMIVLFGAPVVAAHAPASTAGTVQAADPGDEDPVNAPANVPGDPQPQPQGAFPGEKQPAEPGLQPGAGQGRPTQGDATKGDATKGDVTKDETSQKGNSGLLGQSGRGGLLGLGLLGL
ncbi:hypothetical protein [Streptomyces olivaceiscleroticus]|uniref:Uncharacterized protein n=1 Tax=Streptomyces olivaceiscleroticus TaxID=68245 RepID=A0ABP3JXF7_9ACTN